MFTGSYFNSVDEKSRVFIPIKFRYSIGERVWLSKGVDNCLYLFTLDSWPGFVDEYVANRTLTDINARKLQRFLLGGSHELVIDGSGRIKLPQDHIDYTGIGKDVVFVGCGDRIEIWGAEAYAKEMDPKTLDPNLLMSSAAPAAKGDSGAVLASERD